MCSTRPLCWYFSARSFKRGREQLEAAKSWAALRLLQQGMAYVSLLQARNLDGWVNREQASSRSWIAALLQNMGTVKLDLNLWGCMHVCETCAKAASQGCNRLLSAVPCHALNRVCRWSCLRFVVLPTDLADTGRAGYEVENLEEKLLANRALRGRSGRLLGQVVELWLRKCHLL